MAAIKDYDSQISPLAPLPGSSPERLRAQPEDFGGGQGMAVAGRDFAAAADTLDKVQQQQDITNVTVQMAQARQQWTNELNSRYATSKPGDPNFATNFNNDFNSYMEAVGNNAQTRGGQAAFQRAKAELTSTMLEKSATLQVHSAGVAAKQNYETAMDANRSTLVTDPTQFPSVLADADHALNDPNGPYYAMGPDARAALQRQTHEQLALSAVQGNIKNDPEGTLKQLQDGKWDQWLTGPARNAAENSANTAVQAGIVKQMQAERAADKAKEKAVDTAVTGVIKQLVHDPNSVKPDDILNIPFMKPEEQLRWVGPGGILDRVSKQDMDKDTKTYGDGFYEMLKRVSAPPSDPNRIIDQTQLYDSVGKPDGITVAGLRELTSLVQSKRTPEGEAEASLMAIHAATAKQELTGSTLGFRDPRGEEQLAKYMATFFPAYQSGKAAGKSPTQLLNPDSPDYVGKALAQFKRPPAVFMKDLIEAGNPAENVLGKSGAASAAPSPGVKPPAVGEVRQGYVYKGGDPAKPESWSKQ